MRLLLITAVLAAYLLLRVIIYLILRPSRGLEQFRVAHHATYTFFIVMMLLELITAGILSVCRVPDDVMRNVLYLESAVVYLAFLVRKAQILSLSCNPLRTFLYLCALELIPSAALIVSAVLM